MNKLSLSDGWQRHNRSKAIIAGCLALLLIDGGSFALWSDSVSAPNSDVKSGHLNLSEIGTPV